MKLSQVAFIFGSLQHISLANGENLLRGNKNIVENETRHNNIFASTETQRGRCKALIQVSDNGNSPDSRNPVCMLDDGTIVPIVGRGSTFWEQKMESGEFSSGETQVTGCEFVQSFEHGGPAEECFIPEGRTRFLSNVVDSENQEEHERRNLAKVNGNRKILVVRVIANDKSTTAGESALALDVFDDSVNVATQYNACSQGKLNFVKANNKTIRRKRKGRGETSINNGVTTVRVNMSTGKGDWAMQNAITAALKQNFGVSSPAALADHVMYCLPPGTMNGIAYAYVNSWMSVYSDQWCGSLSGQMHEIGHNLNLAHANEKGAYNDQTGMMGYSYFNTNGPLMCFNAAQSWQLGWYSEKAVTLNKSNKKSHVGVLGGIADYSDSNNIVLVKLNTGKSTDYYVNFNRRTGINSGTVEGGNQVTVVKAGEGTGYAESELVAKLNAGNIYTIENFDGTTATIQVHSIGATADVSICIGPCPVQTPSPSKSPTPSSSPSLAPSLSLVPSLSLAPSLSLVPSQSPTKSSAPSSSPSLRPSQSPSTKSSTPSSSPSQECVDSSTWTTTVRKGKRRQKKGCNWIKKTQACGKKGTGRVTARDACPVACGECPV